LISVLVLAVVLVNQMCRIEDEEKNEDEQESLRRTTN
jgi:hypothetical protein